MKRLRLGEVLCSGVPVYVEEEPVDTLALEGVSNFTVQMGIRDEVLDMGLSEVRALKRLLHRAEQQILLRHEQAMRSRNLHLDL